MVVSTSSTSTSTISNTKAKSTSSTNLSTSTKSHSTSAMHKVGTTSHKKAHPPSHKEPPHKAGLQDPEAAKQALAEGRRKAREKAEMQAKLDKEKAEQARILREAEEKRLAEELAIAEAKQREMELMYKKQEEERQLKMMEEKEERDIQEKERLEKEKKQKEEEKKLKEEQEKKAREDAEKRAIEEEERLRKEEFERQERKKRVEAIMVRTRLSVSGDGAASKRLSLPEGVILQDSLNDSNQDTNNEEDTKKKVSEILQKFNVRSISSNNIASTVNSSGDKTPDQNGNKQSDDSMESIDSANKVSNGDKIEQTNEQKPEMVENKNPTTEEILAMYVSSVETEPEFDNVHQHENDIPTIELQDETNCILMQHSLNDVEESPLNNARTESEVNESKGEGNVCLNTSELSVDLLSGELSGMSLLDDKPNVKDFLANKNGDDHLYEEMPLNGQVNGFDKHLDNSMVDESNPEQNKISEEEIWRTTELIMRSKESAVKEALENSGIVAEGDDDEDGEEGQIWKVVERRMPLSEVL